MKLFSKIMAIALAGAISIIGFSGCKSNDSENKLEEIKESGELVVYTNLPFPPYEFQTQEGEIVGVDVEIGQAIAEELGVELKIVPTTFGKIIPDVESGKCDVGIASIAITDERSEIVDFSVPYSSTSISLITLNGSDINSVEDLADKSVAAQIDTTAYSFVQKQNTTGVLAQSPCKLHPFEDATDLMLELESGSHMDAVVVDSTIAQHFDDIDTNNKYSVTKLKTDDGVEINESNAVAVAKGNEDLLEVINGVINEMTESGEIDRLINEYIELSNEMLTTETFYNKTNSWVLYK